MFWQPPNLCCWKEEQAQTIFKGKSMDKVLITGATGFIGQYVVYSLYKVGYDIITLSRTPFYNVTVQKGHIKSLIADITQPIQVEQLKAEVDGCKAIIHLAAAIQMSDGDITIDTNIKGTYYLLKLANELSISKFIYLSSIPLIGMPLQLPITENHPVNPKSLYHITKYAGEQLVQCMCKNNTEWNIIRIPSPIGRGMKKNTLLSTLLSQFMENKPVEIYGTGSRIQNYIDVRDVADFIVNIVPISKSGCYLISGEQSISNIELAQLCSKITKSHSKIFVGRYPDPEENMRWVISSQKAKKELDYNSKFSLEESISWIYQEKRK